MRKLMAIFLAACCMIFVSCGREKAFEGKVNTLDGVSMTVLQDTVTSRTMTLQILNTTDQEIYCGNDAVYELPSGTLGQMVPGGKRTIRLLFGSICLPKECSA